MDTPRPRRPVAFATLIALLVGPGPLLADASDDSLLRAREHLQRGRYDEALAAYQNLAKRGVEPGRVAIGLSRCRESRGEWKQATEGLAAAVKRAPADAALWAALARIQFAHGRLEEAGASADTALRLDPEQPQARLVRADLFAATGRLSEASDAYRWFVRYYNRKQPKDPETLLLVAEGSAQYARWNSVPDIFDFVINELCPDVLKADPDSWQTYFVSGSLLLEKYNRVQALPDLEHALAINPRAADVQAALGRAEFQQRNLAEAERRADLGLAIDPDHVAALRIKAALQVEGRHTREALGILEHARAVNPCDERTLAAMAACYLLEDGPPPAAELTALLGSLDHIEPAARQDSDRSARPPSRFARLVLDLAARNPRPGVFLSALGETVEGRLQFDLAEVLYARAMAIMPQLSAPKTDLGLLYMRTGRNEAARPILDQAFEADPYDGRVLNMRKVLEVLDGYQAITTDHFVIRVDPLADKLLGTYVARYLEEEYAGLVKLFGFEPKSPTPFEIYSNSKGAPAQQWFAARMLGLPWIQTIGASTGMVVALASPTAVKKPFNWARVVRHEFVHIITLQQTRFNIPHWYTEALAVMSEGYPRPAQWDTLLVQRSAQGKLMNLDDIDLGFIRPRTPGDWLLAYCQSELYAQYMNQTYGPGATAKLLGAYRDRLTTAQAIPRAFGVDQAAFERGYREYLKTVVAEIERRAPTGTGPTPAAGADTTRSKSELEQAVLADPDDGQARKRLARMSLDQGAFADAARYGQMALQVDVRDLETHRILGAAYAGLAQPAQAIEEFGVALELKPGDPEIGVDLARAELAAGRKERAKARLDVILGRYPDNARARELRKGLD